MLQPNQSTAIVAKTKSCGGERERAEEPGECQGLWAREGGELTTLVGDLEAKLRSPWRVDSESVT